VSKVIEQLNEKLWNLESKQKEPSEKPGDCAKHSGTRLFLRSAGSSRFPTAPI